MKNELIKTKLAENLETAKSKFMKQVEKQRQIEISIEKKKQVLKPFVVSLTSALDYLENEGFNLYYYKDKAHELRNGEWIIEDNIPSYVITLKPSEKYYHYTSNRICKIKVYQNDTGRILAMLGFERQESFQPDEAIEKLAEYAIEVYQKQINESLKSELQRNETATEAK